MPARALALSRKWLAPLILLGLAIAGAEFFMLNQLGEFSVDGGPRAEAPAQPAPVAGLRDRQPFDAS